MSRKFGIAGAAGGILTLALELFSLATPNWIEITAGGSFGLWKACIPSVGCVNLADFTPEISDYIKAVRALMAIGCFFLVVAFLISVVVIFTAGSNSTAKIIIAMFSVAGLCILIAMATFTGKETLRIKNSSYGFSYIFGWLSVGLSLIVSISLGMANRKQRDGITYSAYY